MKTTRMAIYLVMASFVMCFCCSAGIFDNTIHIYKYGPATFSKGEIPVDEVVMRLKTSQWPAGRPNPVSSSLYALLDEPARQAIEKYIAERTKIQDPFSESAPQQFKAIADSIDLEAILITNFNRIIQGPCIYDKNFQGIINGVELSPSTKKLLKQKPQGNDLIRLNWLLLEDAGFAGYRAAIEADGNISGVFINKERIINIEILPKKLSEVDLRDIWVTLSPTNRIALADITEDKVKSYADNHHFFKFDRDKLIGFGVDVYGYEYPTFIKGNVVGLGSLKKNSSLTLPCSPNDFEKVFGKANEIDRMTMW
jgi:hypothetical protein